MTSTQQYLSIAQTADALGVSERSVRRWIDAGRITAVRIGPKLLRVPAESLAAFIEQQ